jgi:(p)ppGpp synthase/HD superfamily hydrolase
MKDDTLIARARAFAIDAHDAIGHRRKYSGRPYTEHLARVAARVEQATSEPAAIAAAWLHDVVEDTPTTHDDIERRFGSEVARLVFALTDVPQRGGSRAARKALDRARLTAAPALAQTVKLADVIDNAIDIAEHDRNFARIFLREMGELVEVLTAADHDLRAEARAVHERLTQSLRSAADRRQHPDDQRTRGRRDKDGGDAEGGAGPVDVPDPSEHR